MRRDIPVTPELERTYAGKSCWDQTFAVRFDLRIVCGEEGPQKGRCTLRRGHDGPTHIAHLYALSHETGNYDTIHSAWLDCEEDLYVDTGL